MKSKYLGFVSSRGASRHTGTDVKHDLRICPELVLIVGTKLAIPGARSIAADFCDAARSVGGASFWISKEEPMWSVKSLCDYVLIGDCDKVIPLDI